MTMHCDAIALVRIVGDLHRGVAVGMAGTNRHAIASIPLATQGRGDVASQLQLLRRCDSHFAPPALPSAARAASHASKSASFQERRPLILIGWGKPKRSLRSQRTAPCR